MKGSELQSKQRGQKIVVNILSEAANNYIPLISEMKRLGKVIYLAFFLEKAYES